MEELKTLSVGEVIRKAENDYNNGTSQLSTYVNYSLSETLDTIDAYANSKHISGEKDSLGRDKPFFDIVTSAVNVTYRATDLDRKHIKLRATKASDWINSFLATIHLQDWMRRNNFGQFLNDWGKSLARYGSSVVKFVENEDGLHTSVVPWNRLICDAVDFDGNVKIEILELTPAQLQRRVETHGYDQAAVDSLMESTKARETKRGEKKDTISNFIKLYELHGELSEATLKEAKGKKVNKGDDKIFVQQMHVIAFTTTKKGRKTENEDFSLFAGREKEDPYMLTHLIEEEGRTLSIGTIEHLFQAQWMQNHSVKSIKDQLDLASKLIFQTSDPKFLGNNVLTDMESGDFFIHALNQPVTQLNNQSHDLTSASNFAVSWKSLGNEINGISEAMLGATPKSGTAWRQTEAMLGESHSLFELMTENKGLAVEQMLRLRILPNLKKKMDNADEIATTLEQHDINRIDSIYIKNISVSDVNKVIKDKMIKGEQVTPEEQELLTLKTSAEAKEALERLGNKRFFKPSDFSEKTWNIQFEDFEWDTEIDITGEAHNIQESLTTLSTALKLVTTPGFEQNNKAQALVGRVLELTGAMSPVEYNSIPSSEQPQVAPGQQEAEQILEGQVTQ